MKYRLTIVVDVDTESLAQHDGDLEPPPNDVRNWEVGDLFEAYQRGWINPGYERIEDVEARP